MPDVRPRMGRASVATVDEFHLPTEEVSIKLNSAVFYEGASQLTGAPIVGVLTGLAIPSRNAKTGDMLQAWMLAADQSPREAIERGKDDAICGDCSLRGDGVYGRGCYVTFWQAPLRIWLALPKMPRIGPGMLSHRLRHEYVRLGAYGDPTAIPVETWTTLLRSAAGAIGYTQQWKVCDDGYRAFLMASVLSTVDQADAVARGWRTYRVRGPLDRLLPGEVVCPASNEADHKLSCAECMLCSGAASDRRANPVIIAHGKPTNLRAFGVKPPTTRRSRKVISLRAV